MVLDASGYIYVTGYAAGSSFPTTQGAFQRTNHAQSISSYNAFVSKLALASATTDHGLTTMTLTAPPALTNQGQPITLTSRVANVTSGSTPTGSVIFYGDPDSYSKVLAFPTTAVTLDSHGSATLTSSTLPVGLYAPLAYYLGDSTHLSSFVSPYSTNGPSKFRIVGPPALMTGHPHNPTNGPFVYGNGFYAVDATVTDSAGYGLGGVKIVFSGAGFTVAYPYGLTTQSGGYNYVQLTPTTVGNLVATASVAGLEKTVTYPFTISGAALGHGISCNLCSPLRGRQPSP